MVLERLGSSLYEALRKVFRSTMVDEETVKELVRDIQRALLQADTNVELVLEISKRIEDKARERVPPGISRREHVIKVVYDELTRFLGEKPVPLQIVTGKKKVLMLVGIQGSGKTTTSVKMAKFFQKRGTKTALICSDNFRPGAYAQLQQLAKQANIPMYGDAEEEDPIKIALDGVKKFDNYDIIIIDTAGRHKDENELIQEMKMFEKSIKPAEIVLVIDGTIGQQAAVQARAFHEATPVGSIFVAKLDGSARGGGALSAVAATGAPIRFIGTGEGISDLEVFSPSRFVGRLLGMGDLESLIEKVREAEVDVSEKKVRTFLSGKFTLKDMYDQIESMKSMGPFGRILKMLPGFSYNIPDEAMQITEDRLKKWPIIIQSMTPEERENPKTLNSSRIRRVARGSGTTEKEVRELLKQFTMMRKMMRTLRRQRFPFLGKSVPMP